MQRMVLIAILSICGTAFCGEITLPVESVFARGFVLADKDNQLFFEHYYPNKDGGSDHGLAIVDSSGDKEKAILFKITTATQIAEEVEPYLLLSKRGKKFEELITINDAVSLTISNDDEFQIKLSTDDNVDIILTGKKAEIFFDAAKNAQQTALHWAAYYFDQAFKKGMAQVQATSTPASAEISHDDSVIDLAELTAAYYDNEYAAEQKYKQYLNQPITVVGTVRMVSQDRQTKKPRLLFDQTIRAMSISCIIEDESEDIASLQKGQTIVVSGIWQGKKDGLGTNITNGRIVKR